MNKMLTPKQLASAIADCRRVWPSLDLEALVGHLQAQADALSQAREAWKILRLGDMRHQPVTWEPQVVATVWELDAALAEEQL